MKYRIEDSKALVRVVSGDLDPDKLTLFSTMKNETGFLPAWLEHHRSIGFEQFLIWDDGSDDGTAALLARQPDCVTVRSDLSFGETLRYVDPDGKTRTERVGTYFKMALPHVFLKDRVVGYLDADEFLLLPPGVSSVAQVLDRMAAQHAAAVLASVVEFFPKSASDLTGDLPQSFADLIAAYPYFQAEALVAPSPGQVRPALTGQSKTAALFERYGVTPPLIRRGFQKIWMSAKTRRAQSRQTSPRHKTPLILRSDNSRQVGSHNANQPPAADILLTVAHFVFTAQFKQKIDQSIAHGNHAHGGRKYHGYALLLEQMGAKADGFLDENSVQYTGADQLIACDLMRWPE